MTDRIAEITARCEVATPGPWDWETNRHPNCNGTPWGWIEGPAGNMCWSGDKSRTDAIFIAHARTDIPYLLDRLAEAEQKNKLMQTELIQLAGESVKRDLTLAKLEAEVEAAMEAQRWIPVSEGLPQNEQKVLCSKPHPGSVCIRTFFNARVDNAGYEREEKFWSKHSHWGWLVDSDDITHWMELPTPPEEGAEHE